MSDTQRYGNRQVVAFEAAAEALEIEIRRVLRGLFESIKDQGQRPDWKTFRLTVEAPDRKTGLYIPNHLEIRAETDAS